jgi:hypothetical protein
VKKIYKVYKVLKIAGSADMFKNAQKRNAGALHPPQFPKGFPARPKQRKN